MLLLMMGWMNHETMWSGRAESIVISKQVNAFDAFDQQFEE